MQPKNLIYIMSDQHQSKFMSCLGHSVVKTPNLDALAARGTLFENAYTNSPICVPARASLATGRYVHDCGNWDNAVPYNGSVKGWGHRLIEQGHRSVSIGKLHYRDTNDPNGFDQEIVPLHVVDGVGDLLGQIRSDMPERHGAVNYSREVGPGETTYTRYDASIASEAVDWLKTEAPKNKDKPWVLFVSFVCPHFPLIAPPEFYHMYPECDVPMPALYGAADRPDHPYYEAMLKCINYDKHFDENRMRKAIAGYLGLVSYVDHNIGQVLNAIEAEGLGDNTRVIYSSDHGESLGKRGFWGKSTMFEESAAVPLIIAGPDIAKGARVETPVSLVDAHPTILEAVGAQPHPDDTNLPGTSLFDIADGRDPDRIVLSEYHAVGSESANFMVRKERYKLIWYEGLEPDLFDLEDDPDETVNLATDPTHAATLAHMEEALRSICDPTEVDHRAKSDQAMIVAVHGGREAIVSRGDFGYSPAPGQNADFAS